MKITDFFDYREYLRAHVKSLPSKGKGELSRIAKAIEIQTSVLSQILNGRRELTMEQASLLADYLSLNSNETFYLFELIQYERAKSPDLKNKLKKKLLVIRDQALSQNIRAPDAFELTANEKEVFYSNWYYIAIWLLSSLESPHTTVSLAGYLNLPIEIVEEAVGFLLKAKLCIISNGRIKMGPQRTHLESNDELRRRHHVNWRVKALDDILLPYNSSDFHFSFPVSISVEDTAVVKEMLRDFIRKFESVVKPSKSEKVFCLNFDWFEV